MPSSATIHVRQAHDSDAPTILTLLAELGFAVDEASIRHKIAVFSTSPADRIYVATSDATLVGVIAIHITPLLHMTEASGRLTILVVDRRYRNQGIAQELIRHAEAFAWACGCTRVELVSRADRREAHALYTKINYRVVGNHFIKYR